MDMNDVKNNMKFNCYKCPCGKGEIVDDKDDTPGFRSHDVFLTCDKCREKYEFDFSKGKSRWRLKNEATGEVVK